MCRRMGTLGREMWAGWSEVKCGMKNKGIRK